MKKLIIAMAALSVLGATAASAQPGYDRNDRRAEQRQDRRDDRADRRDDRRDARRDDRAFRWSRGQNLPRNYWGRQYVVNDWRARHLRQPPRGYHWVHVDNNYVLAAVTTGLIADILANR